MIDGVNLAASIRSLSATFLNSTNVEKVSTEAKAAEVVDLDEDSVLEVPQKEAIVDKKTAYIAGGVAKAEAGAVKTAAKTKGGELKAAAGNAKTTTATTSYKKATAAKTAGGKAIAKAGAKKATAEAVSNMSSSQKTYYALAGTSYGKKLAAAKVAGGKAIAYYGKFK